MAHTADPLRYSRMPYAYSGKSGLQLPRISLGLWHNFGGVDDFGNGRRMLLHAFDRGITHFDLANNYGPPPGSAEESFGRVISSELKSYRDELIISTKAGYLMWEGPYGEWGSRKYLLASLEQSLKRMKLDYVDIFYSHRYDPNTPLEETMGALAQAIRQGKTLYVGISNYPVEETRRAFEILEQMGVRLLIHQPKYSLFERWVENGLLNLLEEKGIGCIPYSPLAQGMLTDRYLHGIPEGSRASKKVFLTPEHLTPGRMEQIRALNGIAASRGQSLSQLALSWLLKDSRITSVLIGASSVEQLDTNLQALENPGYSPEELQAIEAVLV